MRGNGKAVIVATIYFLLMLGRNTATERAAIKEEVYERLPDILLCVHRNDPALYCNKVSTGYDSTLPESLLSHGTVLQYSLMA